MSPRLSIDVLRNIKVSTYPFTNYFKGFETIEAVRRLFGEKTESVLQGLRVEFVGVTWAYMAVSDLDGHLIVSADYLKNGDFLNLYLDIIHELTHVRQFMDGEALVDGRRSFIDQPAEIEAYRNSVEEARSLGLSDEQILEYLKKEWMSQDDLHLLAQILKVKVENST